MNTTQATGGNSTVAAVIAESRKHGGAEIFVTVNDVAEAALVEAATRIDMSTCHRQDTRFSGPGWRITVVREGVCTSRTLYA